MNIFSEYDLLLGHQLDTLLIKTEIFLQSYSFNINKAFDKGKFFLVFSHKKQFNGKSHIFN